MKPLLVLLLATLLGTARADVLTFPTCGTTLQACIDAADPGDTVQLAADLEAAEEVRIGKSLTLEAAPGTQPVLAFGTLIGVYVPAGAAEVTIRNLAFRSGYIDVAHESKSPLVVTIDGNRFLHGSFARVISIAEPVKVPDDPYGPLTATITGNVLVADGADASNGIYVGAQYSASLSVVAARNVVEVVGPQQSGVRVDTAVASATVDLLANRVFGDDFGGGVVVAQGKGTLRARVVDNEVTGQLGDGGAVDALYVGVEDGHGDVLVLNNSIVGNHDGAIVASTAAENLQAVVANNIVAFNERRGMTLSPWVTNRSNLVFANGEDAFVPGPDTRVADPRFVPDTFRLRDDSPARDTGATDLVPADVTTDVGGAPRVRGAAVDLGAYEHPCPGCDPAPPPPSCDDGDPCTVDATDGVACTHAPVTGVAAVTCTCTRPLDAACAGQDVPAGVRRKAERACTLVAGTGSRKTIKKAARQFGGALRQARSRATRRHVGSACAEALTRDLGDTVARTRSLLGAP